MTYSIDKLFGSRTRVALLSKLMMNAGREFYIRELSVGLKIPYSMVYKEIKNLVSLGILVEARRGKITLVAANKKLPYLDELKGLIVKTAGLGEVIRAALSGMEGIQYALVYGSFASGEEGGESDVDLLIVGEAEEQKLLEALSAAETITGREINSILWSRREFAERAERRHHLLRDIVEKPFIMLRGDVDEFGRDAKGRDHKEN